MIDCQPFTSISCSSSSFWSGSAASHYYGSPLLDRWTRSFSQESFYHLIVCSSDLLQWTLSSLRKVAYLYLYCRLVALYRPAIPDFRREWSKGRDDLSYLTSYSSLFPPRGIEQELNSGNPLNHSIDQTTRGIVSLGLLFPSFTSLEAELLLYLYWLVTYTKLAPRYMASSLLLSTQQVSDLQ